MKRSSLTVLCILLSCSVWIVQGKYVAIDGHQDQNEVDVSAEAQLGPCRACKWVVTKIKEMVGSDASVEVIKSKLHVVCNQIKFRLKSVCQRFVQKNLGMLVKELRDLADAKTICVMAMACDPKEFLMEKHYPEYKAEGFSGNDMDN